VPTQQSFRLNEEVPESSAREQLCECRQNCPICWFQHWSLYLSSEDCHLVAQHDDLNCEVGISSTNDSDQLEDAAERPVREGEGHGRILAARESSRQSAGHGPWMAFTAPTGFSARHEDRVFAGRVAYLVDGITS
jgi:hypothetical protein